uniref:Uncharacterized protein n=1 Tax=Trieres chinensis TaxID=1514140 RepID=A0A7S2A4T6_TRICV|mmetsp:Transcript_39707/g.81050  ORF Transcript_39707/g.81050 Transcript_39707/m.81050 type:complete len:100 (+) Transcript_39707:300-599(+)
MATPNDRHSSLFSDPIRDSIRWDKRKLGKYHPSRTQLADFAPSAPNPTAGKACSSQPTCSAGTLAERLQPGMHLWDPGILSPPAQIKVQVQKRHMATLH